jgi:co-chaperonin GroES (HSP10)
MGLKPGALCILVTPTGDNNQSEEGSLIVVHNTDQEKILRGVVEAVGDLVQDTIKRGDVAFYYEGHYTKLLGKHVVSEAHIVGWETDDE